ncbi:dimethyl sulfoxide reductase anchor subunit family protein [Sagittula sp. S175]|uniref:dimethyl sulfoxide reductase anchor subunit family protein n=1 Tax=Sagittula sp. S175 TaxID=3415129 RepID=UPI003C7CD409
MHPAPSLIAFTFASGLGFGLLFWLGIDTTPPTGWVAFVFYLIGYALCLGGLASSAKHLRHPERALKAFTQWRSSWLSREAWLAGIALVVNALYAAGLVFIGVAAQPLGWLGALGALATVAATAMIYTQLKTVPRWHHWTAPALFMLYAVTGGALLSGRVEVSLILLTVTGAMQGFVFLDGDRRLARSGTTLATATGLQDNPRAFEAPHTGSNYLTREMAFRVARKHADFLRIFALAFGAFVPAVMLLLPFNHFFGVLALLAHVAGGVTARWLFFAEAEHVVGLYYGKT